VSGKVTSSATGSALNYTVPTGKLAIVRSVDVFVDVASSILLFGRAQTNNDVFLVSTQGVPANGTVHWEGRQVFYAGDVMSVLWVSGTTRIMASGYLLAVS
jgi:hypothetical protein